MMKPTACTDYLWPHANPLSASQIQHEQELETQELGRLDALADDVDVTSMQAALDGTKELLSQEDDRRTSVDSRLSAIISLTTPANALVVGIIALLTAREAAFGPFATTVVTLAGVYVVSQLVCALNSAVRGLGRRGYRRVTLETQLPEAGESRAQHLKRQIKATVKCFQNSRRQNNDKVTQMAVAHRAAQNAVAGFLFAVAFLFLVATWRGCTSSSPETKQDHRDQALRKRGARIGILEQETAELKKRVASNEDVMKRTNGMVERLSHQVAEVTAAMSETSVDFTP